MVPHPSGVSTPIISSRLVRPPPTQSSADRFPEHCCTICTAPSPHPARQRTTPSTTRASPLSTMRSRLARRARPQACAAAASSSSFSGRRPFHVGSTIYRNIWSLICALTCAVMVRPTKHRHSQRSVMHEHLMRAVPVKTRRRFWEERTAVHEQGGEHAVLG